MPKKIKCSQIGEKQNSPKKLQNAANSVQTASKHKHTKKIKMNTI